SQVRWQEGSSWIAEAPSAGGKVALGEQDTTYQVVGKDFRAVFSKKTGALQHYTYKNQVIVNGPLLPNFTRPATDNDRRGWKPQLKLKYWYNIPTPREVEARQLEGAVQVQPEYALPADSAAVQVRYLVNGSGTITVDYNLHVQPGLPNIPKVGMQMGINPSFEQIRYYGLGAMENYPDRAYGFDLGVYEDNIDAMLQDYLYPQETGNRMDVRWYRLQNADYGLLVEGGQPLYMSAWPYSQQQISSTKHWYKLKKEDRITLNVDFRQMGIGGNDTWTDVSQPLEKYQIPARN